MAHRLSQLLGRMREAPEEPPLSPLLSAYLEPARPMVLVDVGACTGGFLAAVRDRYPVARAVLVEPVPESAASIRARGFGPSVAVIERAAADRDGASVPYWVNEFVEASSMLPLRRDLAELSNIDTRPRRQIVVETVTLDRLYRDQGLDLVDLLKIDVQGAERMVLAGAREALTRTRRVWIETSFKAFYDRAAMFPEVYDLLTAAGFELREISPGYRSPTGELLQADCLFVDRRRPLSPRPRRWSWPYVGRAVAARASRLARRFTRRGGSEGRGYSNRSFSQCGEDLIVRYLLGLRGIDRPTFLDVGAHHPWYLSNTALLYCNGSRGINVEPNRELIAAFERERPEDVNICAAVGRASGTIDLHVFADSTLSTCSTEEARRLQESGHRLLRKEPVAVRTLVDLVQEHARGRFPDFLNLDAEGWEREILQPLTQQGVDLPKVIAVEAADYSPVGAGRKRQDLIDVISSLGYLLYADTNLNSVFVRRDFWAP